MKYFLLILGVLFLIIGIIDIQKSVASALKGKWQWNHFVIVVMRSLVIAGISLYLAYLQFTR